MTSSDPAVQFYSGNFINVPRKKAHGGPKLNYTTYSSIVVEQQGYIDAINNPEWEQDQICEFFSISIIYLVSRIPNSVRRRLPRQGLQVVGDLQVLHRRRRWKRLSIRH